MEMGDDRGCSSPLMTLALRHATQQRVEVSAYSDQVMPQHPVRIMT